MCPPDDDGLRRDKRLVAGELDVVELREQVPGEDRNGQPIMFDAGTSGPTNSACSSMTTRSEPLAAGE